MSQTVYLNGEFLPIEQAYIPVLDRGFIFGDGVYEVIPVYSGYPFRLQEHLKRLDQSLAAIQLANPHDTETWVELIRKLLVPNMACSAEYRDISLYLQVTRGPAPRDHAFPKDVIPTVFMMCSPLVTPSAALREQGVAAISAIDFRWDRCDIKATSLLPNVLLRQMAVEAGAIETVLFRDGILTEGAVSNIFAVEGGVILAPPKDQHMLPGITYDLILELAQANKIPLEIGYFEEERIRAADELWTTSSAREILPITTLDGKLIGEGRPGPLFKRMYEIYQDYKLQVMRTDGLANG
ncbi:MAG TPA: D-amino acid aminotransferase [Methylophilaceae bacterium]|nr:D-amino acid aminotransferase [Methylophilaceae bacterium]